MIGLTTMGLVVAVVATVGSLSVDGWCRPLAFTGTATTNEKGNRYKKKDQKTVHEGMSGLILAN